jgi:hypothetical protein
MLQLLQGGNSLLNNQASLTSFLQQSGGGLFLAPGGAYVVPAQSLPSILGGSNTVAQATKIGDYATLLGSGSSGVTGTLPMDLSSLSASSTQQASNHPIHAVIGIGGKGKLCPWCSLKKCTHCRCGSYVKCDHGPNEPCKRVRYGRRLVCNTCERNKLKQEPGKKPGRKNHSSSLGDDDDLSVDSSEGNSMQTGHGYGHSSNGSMTGASTAAMTKHGRTAVVATEEIVERKKRASSLDAVTVLSALRGGDSRTVVYGGEKGEEEVNHDDFTPVVKSSESLGPTSGSGVAKGSSDTSEERPRKIKREILSSFQDNEESENIIGAMNGIVPSTTYEATGKSEHVTSMGLFADAANKIKNSTEPYV